MSAQEEPLHQADVVDAMLADFAETERLVQGTSVSTDGSGLQHRRRQPFVQIPKHLVWSTHLSKGAKAVLFAMLALPTGADVNYQRLGRLQREGRDAILASLAELRQFGLYRVERQHRPDGTIRMVNRVSEEPVREWIEDGRTYGDQPVPMRLHSDGTLSKLEVDGSKRRDFRAQATRAQPKRRTTRAAAPETPRGPTPGNQDPEPTPEKPDSAEPCPVDPPPTTKTPQMRTTHLGDQLTTRARSNNAQPVDNSGPARPSPSPRAPEVPHWRELNGPGTPMPEGLRPARRRSRSSAADRRPGYLESLPAYAERDPDRHARVLEAAERELRQQQEETGAEPS